ncbi:PREDICTED: protein phosphatase 1D-like [Amphimedon queenslandica]|uniref:PPM-type phosphatase domain-containing protein n=1 Tax=Amphimedon queenslandica TaxID=400682 RepID=A0A1X7TNY3_AMPQE|nr:PREDICTED: protein phosphatase 1D-like [Amphimedon queenslandica]|eukprot:XP_003390138.2 PREDICTED: protein phosphatase 1D-like [Amphimedon queenslandica]
MPSTGVTISVTAETNAGGRKHMEDYIAVSLSPKESLLSNPEMREQAFVGVFDGHGGKEAAKYARENLWSVIQDQSNFLTQDPQSVREAISNAYLQLHNTMEESRASWVPNKTGDLSTAGTTASTVIFRKNHIYVANVGDSTGIMGVRNPRYGEPGEPQIIPKLLTKDHKPEDPEEQENIRRLGGEVALSLKGVMRVVWERMRVKSNGKKEIDRIPFLSVARSLGDFWSYSAQSGEYTVSPVPYVYDFPLDLNEQKFIVLASDGLWNVMSPSDVVNFISDFDSKGTSGSNNSSDTNVQRDVVSALIKEALSRWSRKKLQADNIAVLIAYLSEEEEEEETGAPPLFDVVSSANEATEVGSKSAVSCSEEADSRQCVAIPSIPSPGESSLSPSSSLIERKVSVESCSGENESFVRLFPNGSSVEYESMIKYRHKRKSKKKNKKLSKHKTLLPTIGGPPPLQPMSDIHAALPSPPNSDSHSPPVESCIDSSTSGIMDEEYGVRLQKRSKDDGVADDEDEGVSLPEMKKFKEDLPLPIDFSRLRCDRVSTDNSSDSGSSGIVSDMDSASNTEILLSLLTPPPLADSPLLCTTPKLINSSSLPDSNTLNPIDKDLIMECMSSATSQQE